MKLDALLSLIRAEHERQASLGMTAAHDRHHAAPEWAALLTKQAGDASMAAHFEVTGGGNDLPAFNDAVIQSLAVGFAALGVRLDGVVAEPTEEAEAICECGAHKDALCRYYADCGLPLHQSIGRPTGPHGHHPFKAEGAVVAQEAE